jgi:hypothetical protein
VLGLATITAYRAVVTAIARWSAPRPPVLSQLADLAAVDLFADDLADERVPGITGLPDAALRFACRWGGPMSASFEACLPR